MKTLAWMAIPLTQELFALVDGEDFEQLNKHKWYAQKGHSTFYAMRNANKRPSQRRRIVFMHREILNVPIGKGTDHINHNGLDNRKGNLRSATAAQNQRNQKPQKNGTSKYKGVSWNKCAKKWNARIRYNSKMLHLGYFANEIEAAGAYDKKAKELFGKFAKTNG